MHRAIVALGTVAVVLISTSSAYSERVGFHFEAALLGGPDHVSLFGIPVPGNSPVSGTFSYETTSAGVNAGPGVRNFHQYIRGGYTLDVDHGTIRIAASDFNISVANNFGFPASDSITVDYFYDSSIGVTPERIVVNDASWPGASAFATVSLSWDDSTFEGPDEPKLTASRPETANAGITVFVGSEESQQFFFLDSISVIEPLPGDYNLNGIVDDYDYAEWKSAFGEPGELFHFADGNNDGVVDAADYVVWRDALGSISESGVQQQSVPEPSEILPAVTTLVIGVMLSRERSNANARLELE